MKHDLCPVKDILDIGTKSIDFFGRQVLVYCQPDEIKAALSICTHFGGPLEWCNGELVCQWHGARFDAKTGACTHGPAAPESRGMFLPTRIENESLT